MNCKKKKKKNAFRIVIFRPATGNRLVFFFGLNFCCMSLHFELNEFNFHAIPQCSDNAISVQEVAVHEQRNAFAG